MEKTPEQNRLTNLEGRLEYWENEREVALRSLITATKECLIVQEKLVNFHSKLDA